jgi:hypothetical protein
MKVACRSSVWLLILAAVSFGQGGGRGVAPGVDAIPNLTSGQRSLLLRAEEDLSSPARAVAAARSALTANVFAEPPDPNAIRVMAGAVREAELEFASAYANATEQIQASLDRLSDDQLSAWRNIAARNRTGTGAGRGGGVFLTQRQAAAISQMTADLTPLAEKALSARDALRAAPRGEMPARADALRTAEIALAVSRAEAFVRLQTSTGKLPPEYVSSVIASGGAFAGARPGGGLGFTLPEPFNFADHEGYQSLFDGVSLNGWDGNPKFWRVENGAIVGESTPRNPSGNSYIVNREVEAKDFTLKFEIKVEGSGGSGFQYRSKTGIPWLAPISPEVTANVGAVNLNWMMTGPQADFWPSSPYWTGQFYSENTPMRIMAWRGQVVEGAGLGTKRLMGNIGDREALGRLVRMNDWNQYTVIARGGVLMHILNGQLMAVMVDDDPLSSNNQSGLFGIEIEATTKVSVRNVWLKKLN